MISKQNFSLNGRGKYCRLQIRSLKKDIRELLPHEPSVTAVDRAQLCTSLGLGQLLLVPVELHKGLNTLWSLQKWDNSDLNAFDNKHPLATKANAIKRISFWHKNDMMHWQDFNYMRPKRQLKRVRPLLIR